MLTRIEQISKFHGRKKNLELIFLEFLVLAVADLVPSFFTAGKGKDTRSLFKINLM